MQWKLPRLGLLTLGTAIVYLTLSVLAACVTINVYFPEAAVKDLSERIEEEIRQQAAEETGEAPEEEEAPGAALYPRDASAPSAVRLAGLLQRPLQRVLTFSTVHAAPLETAATVQEEVAAPEISNPAIRRIIDSRAERLPEINRFKGAGVLGENNRALLEIRDLEAVTDLRERATVQRLVKAENTDREQLFREIAAAKGVDLSQLPRIQATYAETLREKARKGDWIQMPDGSWRQK